MNTAATRNWTKVESLPRNTNRPFGKWIIIKDVLKVEQLVTINRLKARDAHKLTYLFRMLDGDGNVYYYGYCSAKHSLAPLDDFGTPDSGCTTIEYFEAGRWFINAMNTYTYTFWLNGYQMRQVIARDRQDARVQFDALYEGAKHVRLWYGLQQLI